MLSDPLIFINDKNSLSFANTDQNNSYSQGGSNPSLFNNCSKNPDKSQSVAEEKNEGSSEVEPSSFLKPLLKIPR